MIFSGKSEIMAYKLFVVLMCILLQVFCQNSKDISEITDSFFSNLKKRYDSSSLTFETKLLIDQEVDKFVNETLKNLLKIARQKKQVSRQNAEKIGVEVFDDLKEVLTLNAADTDDLNFFKKHNQLFKVLVTSGELIVYQILDSQVIPIAYHPSVPYSSKIQVCKFDGTTWFIVKHSHGIVLFHFFQRSEEFTIQEIQNIDIPDIKHFSAWHDQTHMFLSVTATSVFHVYVWLEGIFRLIELLPIRANSSAFFVTNESINLVVLEHRKTTILEYTSYAQRFDAVQSILQAFNDVATFQISNDASTDYFLASANNKRTVLYKKFEGAFLPFQEIDPAERVIAVVRDKAIVLFLLKNYLLNVYQYDGWRFVKLNYELEGIQILKSIAWKGEEHLIVKKTNGDWILASLKWSKVKSRREHVNSLKKWCSEAKAKAKVIPKFITDRKPIEASNVNLHKVTVNSVNGISVEKLKILNDTYNDLLSRFQSANHSFTQKRSLENPNFKTLRAKIVRAKCSNKCRINNLVTDLPFNITSKLQRIDDKNAILKLASVHVDTLEGLPCPAIGVKLEDVTVRGFINGISFDDLYENALRKSGDQVVTANHVFDELHVNSLIAPNIEVASSYTRQKFKTKTIYATDLILLDGGLLPLDGEPVTMTGTLTVKKATFNKLIDQRGGITGKGIKKFAPMLSFSDYHQLTGNYMLGNVKITDMLLAKDIARNAGKSLKEMADDAISLKNDVPVYLQFSKNRTVWSNITVDNLPNWLTRKNAQMVKVTGKKITLKDITLPDDVYAQLPIPKIETPVCTGTAATADLRTSSIHVGKAKGKSLEVENVEGAEDLDKLMSDCVTSLNEVDFSTKDFTGPVFIENLSLSSFQGSPLEGFETAMFKWYKPHILKGSIKMKSLNVSLLTATEGIKVPVPSEIRRLSVEGNFNVKTINNVNLDEFLQNVVRINESISLKNVRFDGSVEANEIFTKHTNINLQEAGSNIFLGNKTIVGDLEIEGDFSIPDNEVYPSLDTVTTYVIDGSVRFKKEPNVVNINGKNLQELADSIWMLDQPANLSSNFHMSNVTLVQSFDSYHMLNTPNFGPWSSIEDRMLSKTKLQEIPSTLHFKNAKIPNIITHGNSALNSSDPNLINLLFMSLKKNKNCTISDKWHFEELIIKGDLILEGKLNNVNLSSDVARHDVKVNVISGKKSVKHLEVKYLHGLHFDDWSKDALMQSGTEGSVVVTGKKTFNNLHARILQVDGTVMSKRMENCLTKYGDQIISAAKVIEGSLHAPAIILRGFINDVNFTDLAVNRLTKNVSNQSFKSSIKFMGNLQIIGNLTMKSLQGVDLRNNNVDLAQLIKGINDLKPRAAAIEAVRKNRAKYWYKFEELRGELLLPANNGHTSPVTLTLHHLGNCILISVTDLECDGNNRYYLKPFTNSSRMIVNEILSVDNVPLVIQVSSGPESRITLYQYDYHANTFAVSESIRVPGITEASILKHHSVLWIVTLLNYEMLVLRYETWGDLQTYHLPSSSHFLLDKVQATDEPILVRDDGIWRLDGLAGPRHVFLADMSAQKIESFHVGNEFFVRLTYRAGESKLLKANYVGL